MADPRCRNLSLRPRRRRHASLLKLLGAVALMAAWALAADRAAAQQLIPPEAQPGQIEKRFQTPPVPRATPEPIIPEGERPLPPDQAEEITLTLSGIVVDGATVYTADQFTPLYEALLGQDVTLAQVYGIANAITTMYRNDGYILSRAIVPPQRISGGVVRIRVIEGYIDDVLIEGDVRGRRSLLEAYASRIMAARPLSAEVLERYLLLTEDLPGVTPQAVLTPSEDQPGASDLVIVLDDQEVDGFARIDNRGTKFNGPGQFWLGGGFNSMFGLYDRSTLRFITTSDTEELTFFEIGHEQQIGTEGTKLNLFHANTSSNPGHTLRELDVDSSIADFKIGLVHPFTRARAENVSLRGEFIFRNAETKILDDRLSKDQIRFIKLGVLYDSVDRWGGVNLLGLELNQGLDIFNASENGSSDLTRANGRSDFTKFEFIASRLQRVSRRWSLLGTFVSQYAMSQLLASEEFGLGGERCGRGYDPSELVGDHGACLLLELRFGDRLETETLAGYQFYGFYDIGSVWRIGPTGGEDNQASLASAGLGVRFNLTQHFSGSLEVAQPLTREVGARSFDADSPRGFFVLAARF